MLTLDHNPRLTKRASGPGARYVYRYVLRNGEAEELITGRATAILSALVRTQSNVGYVTDRLLKCLARGTDRASLRKYPDYNCGLQKHIHILRSALAKLGEPEAIQRIGGGDLRFPGGYRLIAPIEIIPSNYPSS